MPTNKQRFSVGNEGGHLVIRDHESAGRSIIAFLPNERRPEAPLNMAGVCVKALNTEVEKYKKEQPNG